MRLLHALLALKCHYRVKFLTGSYLLRRNPLDTLISKVDEVVIAGVRFQRIKGARIRAPGKRMDSYYEWRTATVLQCLEQVSEAQMTEVEIKLSDQHLITIIWSQPNLDE